MYSKHWSQSDQMIRNVRRLFRLIEQALETRASVSKATLRGLDSNFEWQDQPKIAETSRAAHIFF
jgi:hypothetical protein